MAEATGTYKGRLACDGYVNCLAHEARLVGYREITLQDDDGEPILDDSGAPTVVRVPQFKFGENHGRPVAYHEGSYVFLNSGDPSHNDRHHEQFAEINGTTDENEEGQSHHLTAQPDDPHYEEGVTNERGEVTNTRLHFSADKVAAIETGHTEAYTGGDE